ncbi:IQ calmodulin binding motif [Trypanosoma vivax]|nr:IQ calmodulin binding motif [Trypanosoma vivax]
MPHSDAGGIFPPVKGVPNLVPSPVVAEAVKTLVPLPPLSEKVIANAQRGITGVRKMLNNRLATLIRAENAFEEKWRATMMVKNALVTFTFVQDFIKLKVSIRERRARQIALEKSSARRILRFFRLLLSAKEHSDVPIQPVVRIRYFETRAAVTLQKYARRWLARQTLKRLRRERELLHLRATRIQGLYHTRIARLKLFRERSERHKLLAIRTEEEKREYAAVRIQRAYRRHVYRLSKWREAGEIKNSFFTTTCCLGCTVQHLYRKTFAAFWFVDSTGQKFTRGDVMGEIVAVLRWPTGQPKEFKLLSGIRVHRKTRASLIALRAQCVLEREMRNEERRRKAAVTIQCAYRSYVARARMIGMRSRRKQERLLRRNRVFPSFRLKSRYTDQICVPYSLNSGGGESFPSCSVATELTVQWERLWVHSISLADGLPLIKEP